METDTEKSESRERDSEKLSRLIDFHLNYKTDPSQTDTVSVTDAITQVASDQITLNSVQSGITTMIKKRKTEMQEESETALPNWMSLPSWKLEKYTVWDTILSDNLARSMESVNRRYRKLYQERDGSMWASMNHSSKKRRLGGWWTPMNKEKDKLIPVDEQNTWVLEPIELILHHVHWNSKGIQWGLAARYNLNERCFYSGVCKHTVPKSIIKKAQFICDMRKIG